MTFQRLDKEVPNKNNRSSAYNNEKPKINDAKPNGFELVVYKVAKIDDGYKLDKIPC